MKQSRQSPVTVAGVELNKQTNARVRLYVRIQDEYAQAVFNLKGDEPSMAETELIKEVAALKMRLEDHRLIMLTDPDRYDEKQYNATYSKWRTGMQNLGLLAQMRDIKSADEEMSM